MSVPETQPSRWKGRRWWEVIMVLLIGQLAVIFWLADRKPLLPRPGQPAPALWLTDTGSVGLLALQDPTLFATPHKQGFAGLAWLNARTQPDVSFYWSDPAPPLSLAMPRPEEIFRQYSQSNEGSPLPIGAVIHPELSVPEVEWAGVLPTQSTVHLDGELAGRKLMTPLALRSWTNNDILPDSIVQVLVNAEGRPLSWALISPSGNKDADNYALAQARSARFDPLPPAPGSKEHPLAGLAWGQVAFQWHALPAPGPTNTGGAAQ